MYLVYNMYRISALPYETMAFISFSSAFLFNTEILAHYIGLKVFEKIDYG